MRRIVSVTPLVTVPGAVAAVTDNLPLLPVVATFLMMALGGVMSGRRRMVAVIVAALDHDRRPVVRRCGMRE